MTDEGKLEDIDNLADTLLRDADIENVGRIAHKILKLFCGQQRGYCWVALAYALAHSADDGSDDMAAGVFLGLARIFQRLKED